ncbi:MAG: NADH-quinone oxidoreductase subunit J [bacterium]|nr:NADH-quinone oxidoreductase subunit J [bacterium]
MNGLTNPIVFYPACVVMILFALMTINFKNIFYSLISAIIVFFLAGMFFYVLGSEYNAIAQVLIYGIAVPVILGLSIMFTENKAKPEKNTEKGFNFKYFMYLVGGVFVLAIIYIVMTSNVVVPDGFNLTGCICQNPHSILSAFGEGIFLKYIWAFEIVAIILTIIVAGLTLFKKGGKS